MARTKATVRRLTSAAEGDFRWRTIRLFKIKEILPQQKTVNINVNGQIIKTINVRRKLRYFSSRNRFIFFKKDQIVSNLI